MGGEQVGDLLGPLEGSLLTKTTPSCSACGTHCPCLTGKSGKPSSRQGCVHPCQRPTWLPVAAGTVPNSPVPTSSTLPAQGSPCWSLDTPGSVPLRALLLIVSPLGHCALGSLITLPTPDHPGQTAPHTSLPHLASQWWGAL